MSTGPPEVFLPNNMKPPLSSIFHITPVAAAPSLSIVVVTLNNPPWIARILSAGPIMVAVVVSVAV